MLHTSAFNDILYTLQMQHILYDLQTTSIPVFSKHFRKFLSTFDLISVQNIFEQLKLFAKSCLGALVNAIHLHGSDTVGHDLRFLTLFLGCKTTDWPAICGSQSHERQRISHEPFGARTCWFCPWQAFRYCPAPKTLGRCGETKGFSGSKMGSILRQWLVLIVTIQVSRYF